MPTAFETEPNDAVASATIFVADDREVGGEIAGTDDVDHLNWQGLAAGSTFVVEVIDGSISDTVLGLFDSSGALIDGDDGGNDGDDDDGDDGWSRLVGTVDASGTLRVALAGSPDVEFDGGNTTTGTYVLRLSLGLFGGDGDDALAGSAYAETIDAGDGADTVDAGDGDDLIFLGGGDDVFDIVSLGDDTIFGEEGDDFVWGWSGDESLDGGEDDDVLWGSSGDDLLAGGGGDDTYFGVEAGDIVVETAGGGADMLESYVSWMLADDIENLALLETAEALSGTGNLGANLLVGNSYDNLLSGRAGGDVLVGGSGDDTVFGGDDDDTLEGGSGRDSIDGGDRDDVVVGDAGADTVQGGNGADTVLGGGGADQVRGGLGSDSMEGGFGTDTLHGGEGSDTLVGGRGADQLFGGTETDRLRGGGDADTLRGGHGDDTLSGDDGDDLIVGDDGDDLIVGGFGGDVIDGGAGDDTLFYNSTTDSVPTGRGARDEIAGFEGIGVAGGDLIDLTAIDADPNLLGDQALAFVGTAAFTGVGQLRALIAGANTRLQGNLDDDLGTVEFEIVVLDHRVPPDAWSVEDFLL